MPDSFNEPSEALPSTGDTEPAVSAESEAEGTSVCGSHVCDTCIGDNLLKDCGVRKCARCTNPFCIHFASKVDPLTYCLSCLSTIELTRSVVTKTYEHYNESTDVTTSYSRKAREIHLAGEDWLFAQRRIHTLSDAELDMVVEYHRQYLNLLCADQERRRAEKAHRYAGKTFIINPGTATVSTTKTTTTKTTSQVKMNKQKEQASALMQQLLGTMTLEQLQAALLGKKA
jgi:hypothetical protein